MLLQTNVSDQPIEGLDLKLKFAALDLAPNLQLESGFSVLDRERTLIRMEKLYRDDEMIKDVVNLGPPSSTMVIIDMPKSLSIPNRWRQEEIKMHALRLHRPNAAHTIRFEERGRRLYDALTEQGVLTFLYFNYWTRVNYDLLLPYRSRSPQGCRALQTAITQRLGVKNMPTNLAPSSVLESIVGAYACWAMWAGQPVDDYEIYRDPQDYLFLVPLRRVGDRMPKIRPRFRKRDRHH